VVYVTGYLMLPIPFLAGPAVEYNGKTSFVPVFSPPLLGQHTKEILREVLGYNDSQIEALHDSGSVATHDETPNN
jgi:crotonobetainyl-CoA:carnitine CoA-transferase CaiB-like acyl-CoA transferase